MGLKITVEEKMEKNKNEKDFAPVIFYINKKDKEKMKEVLKKRGDKISSYARRKMYELLK